MKSKAEVIKQFFSKIIKIVSRDTSDNYAQMILRRFIHDKCQAYTFVACINLHSLSIDPQSIEIDPAIEKVDKKEIADFIKTLMDTIFSDLFKHILVKELDREFVNELKGIGIQL